MRSRCIRVGEFQFNLVPFEKKDTVIHSFVIYIVSEMRWVFKTWICCVQGVLIPLKKKIDNFVRVSFNEEVVYYLYIPDQ